MDKIIKGTPTNKRAEKVNKIIALKLIKRDHIIYSNFENLCVENINTSYLFCKECERRYSAIKISDALSDESDILSGSINKDIINKSLENIDRKLCQYWEYIYSFRTKNKEVSYQSFIKADAYFLKQALGEKRFHELPFYGIIAKHETGYRFKIIKRDMTPIKISNYILNYLNDEDMKNIKNYLIKHGNVGISTIIKRNVSEGGVSPSKHKNKMLVELDLSKPLHEINDFIKKLHDDFRETDKIKTIYDVLGIEMKSFEAELHKYNIYIKNNRASKSNVQLLTDILFVFDCVHSGFDLGLIVELLNTYYDPKKVEESVVKSYYDFANNFITEKNYSSFICGFLTPME